MESNDELKDIYLKNRTSYFFDENSYESISYKNFMGAKPLRIRFDKIDGFIKIYDRTRYLALFSPGIYGAIYDRIRYLISEKSVIT